MPFSEPIDNEQTSGSGYQASFASSVDPAVRIIVRMTDGDSGAFFGADSDALMQDVVDRLSASPLLEAGQGSRSWNAYRAITPTLVDESP